MHQQLSDSKLGQKREANKIGVLGYQDVHQKRKNEHTNATILLKRTQRHDFDVLVCAFSLHAPAENLPERKTGCRYRSEL